jgi:tetratricopeptide (TPR) repeat protein
VSNNDQLNTNCKNDVLAGAAPEKKDTELSLEHNNDEHEICKNLEKLRKEKRQNEAWQLLYEATEMFPESRQIKHQHCWLLYDFELQIAKASKNYFKIMETAEKILDLEPDELLKKICVFAATDAAKASNQPEKALMFLSYLNKDRLETSQREYKGRKIMSWRERWYFACVNALFETGNYSECRQTCQEAYKDFPHKLEFLRKAALCIAREGDIQKAAEELENLIKNRNVPWYMYSDLGSLFFDCGEIETAWKYSCKAADARGELKTKVNLFELMARIMLVQGNHDGAAAHACLAAAVRKNQKWNVPDSLSELIDKLNASTTSNDEKQLLQHCRQFWAEAVSNVKTPTPQADPDAIYQGSLMMKNPNSPFAFIKSKDFKDNIYVKAKEIPENLKYDGAKVRFKTTSSFDARKNRESIRAISIREA